MVQVTATTLLLAWTCSSAAGTGVPSIMDLQSHWVDPNVPVSAAASLGPEQRDVATINNFWGAAGISPEGQRPVDLFAVNSLELPPIAACGADAAQPFGCGKFMVNGQHVPAAATQWATHQAGRRSGVIEATDSATMKSVPVMVTTATRMPFEQNGVQWQINITNPNKNGTATVRVDIELSATAARYDSVGTWVYQVPSSVDSTATYTATTSASMQKGVLTCSSPGAPKSIAGACARYQFTGDVQPDAIEFHPGSGAVHTTAPNATFAALEVGAGSTVMLRVSLAIGIDAGSTEAAQDKFGRNVPVFDAAWQSAHDKWQERWDQAFTPPSTTEIATANTFWSGSLPTLELPASSSGGLADVSQVFYMSCLTVISQMRTNLPLIHSKVWPNGNGNLGGSGKDRWIGIGGSRSWWWDEALTSMMLALLEPDGRAPTFQFWLGHDDHPGTQFGHGTGNGYSMDCPFGSPAPFGSNKCRTQPGPPPPPPSPPGPSGQEYGFYCYNPWAFYMAMSNHVRLNNATDFLEQHAANNTRNLKVEDALEMIVKDFQEYLIPGTNLVDYGPDMDGFSPTYKHVMPGCSQGNNVWMLRDFASFREAQGRSDEAATLRKQADALSKDSMALLYNTNSKTGHGWFNVVHPEGAANKVPTPAASAPPPPPATSVTSYEMRHVVDFFSMTFGLCGLSDQPCDFTDKVRGELSSWFREESVTSSWIRATSPKCNCSNNFTLAYPPSQQQQHHHRSINGSSSGTTAGSNSYSNSDSDDASWPGFETCHADRPDHGTTGAYPSWPAFATEALCYLDGNCSSAFKIMSSFAVNTLEGPWGQATEVPQLQTAPYTPFNDEVSFKPIKGVNRYIAIEGGSFFDAVVRGFFGYHAPMQWAGAGSSAGDEGGNGAKATPQEALDKSLVSKLPRGFEGTLSNLRTPFGLATITSDKEKGVSIKLQHA